MKIYEVLSNLPQLPEEFEQLAQKELNARLALNPEFTHISSERMAAERTDILIDGVQHLTVRAQQTPLPEEVVDWINANIAKDYSTIGLQFTKALGLYHGAHTDFTRSFAMLYLLEPSEAETVFYQENGFPIHRPKKLSLRPKDYSTLTELFNVVIPPYTWVIFNADVIHGVRNIVKDRRSIYIGFDYDLPLEELPVVKYNTQLSKE